MVIGSKPRSGWDNLSPIAGMGQVVPKYRSKIRGGTMTFMSVGRLPGTNEGSERDAVRRLCENAGLTRCCFGYEKTGLRHSRHCGQQPLRIFVIWDCENLLGIARLYDFALMKNRNSVANPSDRGEVV